jgi:DNA-binding FadR family transcriptional regulator
MTLIGAGPIRRVSLVRQIQDGIRAHISENHLAPGSPLPSETELAAMFQVGRNSVREAVKGLEVLGVIEARSGSGLFVKSFSFDPIVENLPYALQVTAHDLSDLLAVRVALEVGHAEQMIRRADAAQIATLRDELAAWEGEARAGRYPHDRDRRFHALLISRLDNALLAQLTEVFWTVSARALASDRLSAPRDPYETYLAHVPIVEAFEARDALGLEQRLRDHYRGIERRVRASRLATSTTEEG